MITQNPLFENAFNISYWKNEDKIEYLKANLELLEKSVEKYLNGIKTDFPNLTDHSLSHSRMLWDYASVIVGKKTDFINPVEAFILHSVFLIHDAGMCYSILNNKNELENDPLYVDYIIQNGDTQENKNEALFYTVRQRHGDFALRVATEKLNEEEYLIADTSLREELGQIIGKIAKSHTCNINYIEREFGSVYRDPHFPIDWSIDCQKLSFILRTSDAAHIDNLRTPKTLRMISEIPGISREHWTFQKKIGFPHLSDDNLLVYSTNSPFCPSEQKAWWFCYNALQVLDKEIRSANEYFDVKQQTGFSAKGVKSINDTLELGKKYIRTEGWSSINTQIKVSNPVHIASEIGGIQLYGNINIALRELIQNSIDAINLYRIHTGQNNSNVGEIKLSVEKEQDEFYLTITDNGIGMSQTLMSNELLDFGGSYWKSNRFINEYEGIQAKGFESIGKYGIGFFSIFMLGVQIRVTSWKFGEAISNMKTLDFYDGLASNPILREPFEDEKNRIIDRGTFIKVKLNKDPYLKVGFIGNSQFEDNSLFSLVKYFVPSSNVRLIISEVDGSVNTIQPNAIDKLDFNSFIDYIHIPRINAQNQEGIINFFKTLKIELIEITEGHKLFGKLAMLPLVSNIGVHSTSVVMSKGIRISELNNFAGYILTDDVISIKRDAFSKLISFDMIREWALKQKQYIESNNYQQLFFLGYFGLLMTFNFFDENLPIAFTKKENKYNLYSIAEFRKFLKENDSVVFYQEGHFNTNLFPECDGFIKMIHRFNVSNIVREEDSHKLITYKSLLEKIIREEWGDFNLQQDDIISKGKYTIDMPYTVIENYSKKKPSIQNTQIA